MPIQTKDNRGYVGGKFALEIDQAAAGWLWTAEGGNWVADVVNEKIGSDHLTKKHLAGVKYEDISFQCGTGMSRGFYDWIKASFDKKYERRNGAIIHADFDHGEMHRLEFAQALISEIGLPALDAASKDAAKMTLKISPEITRSKRGHGPNISGNIDAKAQKQWLPSNFRLRIDGLEKACSRVNKIDAIVIKQKSVEESVGEVRDYNREPTGLEIPNLVITLAESHAEQFHQWGEDFVVAGNNSQSSEKTGSLEYLSSNLQTVLFTVDFYNLGIFKLTPDKTEAGSEGIRRVRAEMYCEDIKFKWSSAAAWQ